MKKLFILFAFALIISACDKSSSSSSDTSFRIKSGTLTPFNSPIPGDLVNGTHYRTNLGPDGNYAIIYNVPVNGINYVGIALSNNPDPDAPVGTETFNVKIYYQGNSISDVTLIGGTSPGFKVVQKGVGDITGIGSYTFDFTKNTVGTYTTYSIVISGTGALTTTSPDITALYVGTITQP